MSREAESEAIQRSLDVESVTGGDVIALGARMLRVCGKPGEVLTDHRGRVGVRNLETGRLSYLPERTLRQALEACRRREAVTYLAINQCPTHGYWAITVEDNVSGERITPSKCCGRWDTVKRWPIDRCHMKALARCETR